MEGVDEKGVYESQTPPTLYLKAYLNFLEFFQTFLLKKLFCVENDAEKIRSFSFFVDFTWEFFKKYARSQAEKMRSHLFFFSVEMR